MYSSLENPRRSDGSYVRSTFRARFWSKVLKAGPDDCWEWVGSRTRKGYGEIQRDGSRGLIRAHRASLQLTGRHVPQDSFVLHSCHNRRCVNPRHLRLGTASDNSRDMVRAGRSCRGRKHHKAKLNPEVVRQIRAAVAKGVSQAELCHLCDVSEATMSQVVNRKTWRHVL